MQARFLSRLRIHSFHRNSGSTLAATMMVVAAIVAFLSISALVTSQFGRFAGREQGNGDLMAAADAGLEYMYAQWTAAKRDRAVPVVSQLTNDLNSTTLPYNAAGITFSSPTVVPADQNGVATANGKEVLTTTSSVPGYPGWTGQTVNYLASVTASGTASRLHFGFTADSIPSLTVHRVFQYTTVPLFQAAIFYENKLELHPGAPMAVTGLVHTNADLWARGFSSLQFLSNVSYVTSWHNIGDATVTKGWDGSNGGYIPGVGSFAGVPAVTWGSNASTSSGTLLNQVSPIDPFAGASTNNNGLHDMVEVPAAGSTNSSIAYNNASVVVVIDSSQPANSSGRLKITDNLGNALSAADTTAIAAAVNSGATTTIYDQRETQNVVLTTLDMTKLKAATVAASGKTPTALQNVFLPSGTTTPSGTIYIHDVSQVTSSEPAIRMVNGRTLGEDITVASDNGVYIQGDYNTGGSVPSDVPSNVSNSNGSATPQASGYTRYASAVMADAVTILSNNWSDSNASQSLSSRTATPTTVNTAILAGDVPSNLGGNGIASGGAHNFPRFLENWNNINFTYWGSLVEAYHSEEFTGLWQTGNVYYWPNRMWNFDTNFTTHWPPGTASGTQFSRGRWQRD